jgi:hypothetical protein
MKEFLHKISLFIFCGQGHPLSPRNEKIAEASIFFVRYNHNHSNNQQCSNAATKTKAGTNEGVEGRTKSCHRKGKESVPML